MSKEELDLLKFQEQRSREEMYGRLRRLSGKASDAPECTALICTVLRWANFRDEIRQYEQNKKD